MQTFRKLIERLLRKPATAEEAAMAFALPPAVAATRPFIYDEDLSQFHVDTMIYRLERLCRPAGPRRSGADSLADDRDILRSARDQRFEIMWRDGQALSSYFRKQMGLGVNSRVGLLLSNARSLMVTLIACWRAGCLPVVGLLDGEPSCKRLDRGLLDALVVDEETIAAIGCPDYAAMSGKVLFAPDVRNADFCRTQPLGSTDLWLAVARGLQYEPEPRAIGARDLALFELEDAQSGEGLVYSHQQLAEAVQQLLEIATFKDRDAFPQFVNDGPVGSASLVVAVVAMYLATGGMLVPSSATHVSACERAAVGLVTDVRRLRVRLKKQAWHPRESKQFEVTVLVGSKPPESDELRAWSAAGNEMVHFLCTRPGLLSPLAHAVASPRSGIRGLGRLLSGHVLCVDGVPAPPSQVDVARSCTDVQSVFAARRFSLRTRVLEAVGERGGMVKLPSTLDLDPLGVVYDSARAGAVASTVIPWQR